MTTTSKIIKSAYRESNLIPIGQSPTDDEQTEGLDRLNSLLDSVMGNEAGEALMDWPVQGGPTDGVTEFWTSVEWTKLKDSPRVQAKLTSAETLFLPPEPSNGARMRVIDLSSNFNTFNLTLDPNGKKIEGTTTNLILGTDGTNTVWVYRADLGDWIKITDLTVDLTATPVVDTDFPFPRKFDDFFITMLAIRLNPRFGQGMSELTVATFERNKEQFKAEYEQTVVVRADSGVNRLSFVR